MAFEVYNKKHQVIFNWELLVTNIEQSISKHIILLKVFVNSLVVMLNVHKEMSVG